MHQKKALITGISGQDGAYLADFLLMKGYEVTGTSRNHETNGFKNLEILGIKNKIKLISMFTSNFSSVFEILQKNNFDEIYNLSGQSSVGRSFNYPIETLNSIISGTLNILESIRTLNLAVKFYNAGSSEVFGNTPIPANEQTFFNPCSPYATAKASAHYLIKNYRDAYGLFACTGILFNHESPFRSNIFVTSKIITEAVKISNGSNNKISLGNIDISRDWGWAPDYVESMWLMLQQDTPEDFIIATGKSHTLRDFISLSFDRLELNWFDYIICDSEQIRKQDVKNIHGNPSNAYIKLGWKSSTSFEQIVDKLLEAEVNRNALKPQI